jgi:nitrate reductase gamma subunit
LDALLEFARGPLFRLTFALMVLGLLRVLVLDLVGMVEAHRKAGDKTMPWKLVISRTVEWLFPVRRVLHHRPIYSLVSILFHIGLIVTPVFLFAHVRLWKSGLGISWWTLPHGWAEVLTVLTVIAGLGLYLGRVGSRNARMISRKQDYLWPLLLIIPFVTGYICAHLGIAPKAYQLFMVMHILSGELIFVLLPFTKIAHCILMPLSQAIITLAWKFPARVDEDVCETLDKKGAPV